MFSIILAYLVRIWDVTFDVAESTEVKVGIAGTLRLSKFCLRSSSSCSILRTSSYISVYVSEAS